MGKYIKCPFCKGDLVKFSGTFSNGQKFKPFYKKYLFLCTKSDGVVIVEDVLQKGIKIIVPVDDDIYFLKFIKKDCHVYKLNKSSDVFKINFIVNIPKKHITSQQLETILNFR